jgi:hypothetical protein
MGLVEEIRASAEDALERGFAIIACLPHEKGPWAKYSEHGCNSASRNKAVALKPWDDGTEANYGISCGPSNITVLDADHGLTTEAEWLAWKKEQNLPDTLTVLSGRDGEMGIHMYYSGAVPTCGFKLGSVTGELKGSGGYVVGPGSVHPSGKKYVILHDVPVAPLPDGLTDYAKEKGKTSFPKIGSGEKIPVSQRWVHIRSRAGSLRNLGLDEDAIYIGIKSFAANHCEDGENYPDDKLREIASWAGGEKCEEATQPIIMFGTPDPDLGNTAVPELDSEAVVGDYVGDLSTALTKDTFIPPAFARATLKAMLGAVLDGKVAFPGEPTLHMRHWNALISSRPEAGKSVVWERCLAVLSKTLITTYAVQFPQAGFFSSGEHAIRTLAENDGKPHLAYFDEMKELFEKGNNTGSTLFSKLLPLYEQKSGGAGSIANSKVSFDNVSLSMTGGFTREGFDRAVSGKGAGGNGFLSRMVLEYSGGVNYLGDWGEIPAEMMNAALKNIEARLHEMKDFVGGNKGAPFIPEEDDDAKEARNAFQKWLVDEKNRIQADNPDSSYAARLESHFKRDLLIRVVFSEQKRITKQLVERSVIWAKHQLMLREELWPVDNGGAVEKFEKRILSAIGKHGPLTKKGVQDASNARKGEGGFEAWNRAWTNLLKADVVVLLSQKSDRGKDKFGLEGSVWDKKKEKWVKESPTP